MSMINDFTLIADHAVRKYEDTFGRTLTISVREEGDLITTTIATLVKKGDNTEMLGLERMVSKSEAHYFPRERFIKNVYEGMIIQLNEFADIDGVCYL